jgi:predicted enzyme related to lactoylglutathione lyase
LLHVPHVPHVPRSATLCPEEKPMITNIHAATIFVSNQDEALAFYIDKLGWEKRIDYSMGTMRFVTVAPVGGATEIALASAAYHGVKPGTGLALGQPGAAPQSGISMRVEGVDETYRTLVERGVSLSGPPEEMPWGAKAMWMRDPDGNAFFLVGLAVLVASVASVAIDTTCMKPRWP